MYRIVNIRKVLGVCVRIRPLQVPRGGGLNFPTDVFPRLPEIASSRCVGVKDRLNPLSTKDSRKPLDDRQADWDDTVKDPRLNFQYERTEGVGGGKRLTSVHNLGL